MSYQWCLKINRWCFNKIKCKKKKKVYPNNWKAIGRVLGYLKKKTISLRFFYSEFPAMLEGYSGASWITTVSDNKSTSGWIFTLGRYIQEQVVIMIFEFREYCFIKFIK